MQTVTWSNNKPFDSLYYFVIPNICKLYNCEEGEFGGKELKNFRAYNFENTSNSV